MIKIGVVLLAAGGLLKAGVLPVAAPYGADWALMGLGVLIAAVGIGARIAFWTAAFLLLGVGAAWLMR